jgi:uncharacterized phiE125 gp8 family phage protein
MNPYLTLTTAPATRAVYLDEVYGQLRMVAAQTSDDLSPKIDAAIAAAETETNRQLITATWALKLPDFPCSDVIILPKPPLLGVTSVIYTNTAGVDTTVAATEYNVILPVGPVALHGAIVLKPSTSWPTDADTDLPHPVTITFQAGYGASPANVPAGIRAGIMAEIESHFSADPTVMRKAARACWAPYKAHL